METDDALQKAILAAHAGWSSGVGERFPVDFKPGTTGTAKSKQYQRGPGVPAVPVKTDYSPQRTASPETNPLADAWATWVERAASPETSALANAWATWVERAAIREYGGGMSRAEAEVRTALELGPCPRDPGSAQADIAHATQSQ